jgi:hypothetical protein
VLYFPQLSTGSVSQLPLQKTVAFRTLLNALPDGSAIRAGDSAFVQRTYNLSFSGLTLAEANALSALFQSAEGELNTFSFVDPFSNLLCWSTDLTQPCWVKDPGLVVAAGADAFGGTTGAQLSNDGQVNQSVSQVINAPLQFTYAFSCYMRSDATATAELSISGGGCLTATTGEGWQRYYVASSAASNASLTFALTVPAGQTLQVCGLQAEAQPCAGPYKATASVGGAYPNSRFDQDTLTITTDSTGTYSCKVRVLGRT